MGDGLLMRSRSRKHTGERRIVHHVLFGQVLADINRMERLTVALDPSGWCQLQYAGGKADPQIPPPTMLP